MTFQLPLLSLLTWMPIAGGIWVLLASGDKQAPTARAIALVVSLLTLAFALPLAGNFATDTAAFQFVERTPWITNLAADPRTRSNTSVCLKMIDPALAALPDDAQKDYVKRVAAPHEKEGAAFDTANHRDAPASFRIWAGATIERTDLEALTDWLDWAYAEEKGALAKAA